MEEEIIRDKSNDTTRVEHIFSDGLLGRVNDKGDYVISPSIVTELIDNVKYFEKKIGNKIYLYTYLESLERPLMMLMEYKLSKDKDFVIIKYYLIEEEYMADGLTINSVVTEIAHSKYNFSSDVILRAFRDFHVIIKSSGEAHERKYDKKTPSASNVLAYNEQINTNAKDDFDDSYEKMFTQIYGIIEKDNSEASQLIQKEYNTGLLLHKDFFENTEGKPLTSKVKFEILNNAIEKVSMAQPIAKIIQEVSNIKQSAMSVFAHEVKTNEQRVAESIIKNSKKQDREKFASVMAENIVTERSDQGSVSQEIAEDPKDKDKVVTAEQLGAKQEDVKDLTLGVAGVSPQNVTDIPQDSHVPYQTEQNVKDMSSPQSHTANQAEQKETEIAKPQVNHISSEIKQTESSAPYYFVDNVESGAGYNEDVTSYNVVENSIKSDEDSTEKDKSRRPTLRDWKREQEELDELNKKINLEKTRSFNQTVHFESDKENPNFGTVAKNPEFRAKNPQFVVKEETTTPETEGQKTTNADEGKSKESESSTSELNKILVEGKNNKNLRTGLKSLLAENGQVSKKDINEAQNMLVNAKHSEVDKKILVGTEKPMTKEDELGN